MTNNTGRSKLFLPAALIVLAVLFVLLTIRSFNNPVEIEEQIVNQTLQQNVTFGYTVTPKVSTLYPEPQPLNDQKIYFTQVTESLRVWVKADVTSDPVVSFDGTAQVLLVLEAEEYWSREFLLSPEKEFTGEGGGITVLNDTFEIPLQELLAFTKKVEEETRVSSNRGYLLKVTPVITAQTLDGSDPLVNEYKPAITFALNQRELIPSDDLVQEQTVKKTDVGYISGSVSLLGLKFKTSTARYISTLLAALTVGLAIWQIREYSRVKPLLSEAGLINKRYHGRIITALDWRADPGASQIRLSTFKELLKIADNLDKSIICVNVDDDGKKASRYYLADGMTLYFYEASDAAQNTGTGDSPAEDL